MLNFHTKHLEFGSDHLNSGNSINLLHQTLIYVRFLQQLSFLTHIKAGIENYWECINISVLLGHS